MSYATAKLAQLRKMDECKHFFKNSFGNKCIKCGMPVEAYLRLMEVIT